MRWFETGNVPADALKGSRLQLHYAALILGSTADSLLETADDDSQTNLGFNPSFLALETHSLDARAGCFLRLRIPTLTLEWLQDDETVLRFELSGQTMNTTIDGLHDQITRVRGRESSVSLRKYPGFPASPLADGAAFDAPVEGELSEIAHWFANGFERIEALRGDHPSLSAVRIWPHHLDLGGLIALPGGSDRMIGLGLSPGDGYYDQPYFYCTPYPNPAPDADRPSVPVGHWHTQDFVSAIATADEIHAAPSSDESTREYLAGAISACRSLLD